MTDLLYITSLLQNNEELVKLCSGTSTPEEEQKIMDNMGLDPEFICSMKTGYNNAEKQDVNQLKINELESSLKNVIDKLDKLNARVINIENKLT